MHSNEGKRQTSSCPISCCCDCPCSGSLIFGGQVVYIKEGRGKLALFCTASNALLTPLLFISLHHHHHHRHHISIVFPPQPPPPPPHFYCFPSTTTTTATTFLLFSLHHHHHHHRHHISIVFPPPPPPPPPPHNRNDTFEF